MRDRLPLTSNVADSGKVKVKDVPPPSFFQRTHWYAVMPDLVTPLCWPILAGQAHERIIHWVVKGGSRRLWFQRINDQVLLFSLTAECSHAAANPVDGQDLGLLLAHNAREGSSGIVAWCSRVANRQLNSTGW